VVRPSSASEKPTALPQGASPVFGGNTPGLLATSEPDLPADERDDEELDDAALGISLDALDVEDPADEDETSLEIPLDIQAPVDPAEEGPADVFLGELIDATESAPLEAGDAEPLADFDGPISGLDVDHAALDDSVDDDFSIDLPEDLPTLDGGPSAEEETSLESSGLDALPDDAEPTEGAAWSMLEPRVASSCTFADSASAFTFCAGRDLFLLEPRAATFRRLVVSGFSGLGLAALEGGRALLISGSSAIQLVALGTGEPEPIARVDAKRTLAHLSPDQIEVGCFGDQRLMLRAGNGLFEITGTRATSPEPGGTLELVPLGLRARRVLAVPKRSERFWSLVEDSGDPALWRGSDGLERLDEIRLGGAAHRIGSAESPLLAARQTTVALSAFGAGLAVSSNDAKSFRQVAGCAGTTAITIGIGPQGARVYAALHSEVRESTTLVEVVPSTAEAKVIARITPDALGGDDGARSTRVTSLVVDETSGTLVAVGEFGALLWRSPNQSV
jgi:hypothetical protein